MFIVHSSFPLIYYTAERRAGQVKEVRDGRKDAQPAVQIAHSLKHTEVTANRKCMLKHYSCSQLMNVDENSTTYFYQIKGIGYDNKCPYACYMDLPIAEFKNAAGSVCNGKRNMQEVSSTSVG